MPVALTLSWYITRQFALWVTAMLLGLTGLVSMFDFLELLRRAANKPDATLGLITEVAALRLPYIAMQVLPFAVLVGGMLCFWRLTRSSELIVARAAGVSAWQFLAAPTACALLLRHAHHHRGQPALLRDVRPRQCHGERVPQHRRRTAGTARRPTLATPGRPQAGAERRRHHPCARRVAARQAAHRAQRQRVPAEQQRPAAGAHRGHQGRAGPGRLAPGGRAQRAAGPGAEPAAHDRPADRPDGVARAGQLRARRTRCRSGHCPISSRC